MLNDMEYLMMLNKFISELRLKDKKTMCIILVYIYSIYACENKMLVNEVPTIILYIIFELVYDIEIRDAYIMNIFDICFIEKTMVGRSSNTKNWDVPLTCDKYAQYQINEEFPYAVCLQNIFSMDKLEKKYENYESEREFINDISHYFI